MMVRWCKEFYEDGTVNHYGFYRERRLSKIILEEVSEVKHNVHLVKVVDIVSNENFRIMGVVGGTNYQYKIGETFKIRKHKNSDYWYDVERPCVDYCEGFMKIK